MVGLDAAGGLDVSWFVETGDTMVFLFSWPLTGAGVLGSEASLSSDESESLYSSSKDPTVLPEGLRTVFHLTVANNLVHHNTPTGASCSNVNHLGYQESMGEPSLSTTALNLKGIPPFTCFLCQSINIALVVAALYMDGSSKVMLEGKSLGSMYFFQSFLI